MLYKTRYINIDVCTDIDVPVYEIIEQISDKDLIDEVLKRGVSVRTNVTISPVEEYKKREFHPLFLIFNCITISTISF